MLRFLESIYKGISFSINYKLARHVYRLRKQLTEVPLSGQPIIYKAGYITEISCNLTDIIMRIL